MDLFPAEVWLLHQQIVTSRSTELKSRDPTQHDVNIVIFFLILTYSIGVV